MTYLAQAKKTIDIWKLDMEPYECYFAITREIKLQATWDQVADLIIGYLMAQEPQMRIAA